MVGADGGAGRAVAFVTVPARIRVAVALAAWALAVVLASAGASAKTPPGLGAPAAANPAAPSLGVRAAVLIEASTGQQLYGTNADARLPIASATKLMTALITLHHARLGQVFAAPVYYLPPQDSQIGLVPGERMSVHDLLIAMLLPSADDAAEDLAYNIGHRSVARFLGMMNAEAQALGLTHTHYTTPSGLDTPGNYSSAGDLVKLARYLLRTEPFFKAVVRLPRSTLRTGDHVRAVTNLNDLVAHYSWINGVKTGHTLEAGYVLVTSGTQGGMTLIGAVLGAPSEAGRDAASLALLHYGFATFGLRTPVHARQVLARPAVTTEPKVHVRLIAASSYKHVFPKSMIVGLRVRAPAQLTGPLSRHAPVGSVEVVAGHRVMTRIPLLLASEVPRAKVSKDARGVVLLSVTLSGILVAVGAAIGLTMFWRRWHRR